MGFGILIVLAGLAVIVAITSYVIEETPAEANKRYAEMAKNSILTDHDIYLMKLAWNERIERESKIPYVRIYGSCK